MASAGYFATLGVPLLSGRDFDARDDASAPEVVIVNQSLAARAFPGENPIGHKIAYATVIGVVKDSRYGGPRDQPRPVLYHAFWQYAPGFAFASFELRHGAADVAEDARRAVATVDRNLPLFRVRSLRAQAEQEMLTERLLATLSSFFGGLALLLACLGLYGLMAYGVARRTPEIGIRIALGAQRGNVLWLVLRETLWLAAAGVALGVPLVLWTARFARSLLFGVSPSDPLTIAATVAILLAVALGAAALPARRAARVDPMVALRYE